jgi:hypothetical protein
VETDSSNYYPCCGRWCGFLIYFSSAIAGQAHSLDQIWFLLSPVYLVLRFLLVPRQANLEINLPLTC